MGEENDIHQATTPETDMVIEVASDGSAAFLTLYRPVSPAGALTVEAVEKNLAVRGISFGVKPAVIGEMIREGRYDVKTPVAEGVKPIEGLNGSLRFFHETGTPVPVKSGDVLCEILPPQPGTEGRNIYNEAVPVKSVREAFIPVMTNVEHKKAENQLVATCDGYLSVGEKLVKVTPFFEFKVTEDGLEAVVTVTTLATNGGIGPDELREFLKVRGIVYGILDDVIDELFRDQTFGFPVTVARGKRVVNGSDGRVDYKFETKIKPRIDDQGNVDYKELTLIQNVNTGDRIAELVPPLPGVEGVTVFGETTKPTEGVPAKFRAGKNTAVDPADESVLTATAEGCVRLSDGKVIVEPVFLVPGHVDYSTGNIVFIGSVVINKDVKSGFSVKAKGDIQIDGVVEDAQIQSGGSVLMKMGFIGKGGGRITAKGEVHVKFCENETIVAEGDIHLADYALNSRLQTKGTIFATDKHGLIIGGESYASKAIVANIIGSPSGTTTRVTAGVDAVVKTYIQDTARHIAEIDKILIKTEKRKLVKKNLPEKIALLLDQLKTVRDTREHELETLNAELETMVEREEEFKQASITVNGNVYPGAAITIFDAHTPVTMLLKKIAFRYLDGGIIAVNL